MNHSKRGNRRLIRERALAITMAILFASMSVATALAMDLIPSERDTTNLYGGPATLDGKFETADGVPDKQGWVSQDMSPQGVGNFGQLWKDLGDADEDQVNQSPQWAFIDDGVVVEGVGPSYCTGGLFCYGPQGMVTNTTGGLVGGIATLHNEVLSEPIQLPQENGWPVLSLDTYLDNGRFPFQDWLFASYVLDATADPQGLTGWESYSDTFMHGAEYGHYTRTSIAFTPELLPAGMRWVRIRLVAYQVVAIPGGHGTPAPYFDNVRLQWVRGAAAAVPSPVASIAATAVPNPFNPSVTIRWTADAGSRATVRVHDLSGRLVASLFDGEASGAAHEVVWNGRDEAGQAVAAGVYLCRISTGSDARVLKLSLVR